MSALCNRGGSTSRAFDDGVTAASTTLSRAAGGEAGAKLSSAASNAAVLSPTSPPAAQSCTHCRPRHAVTWCSACSRVDGDYRSWRLPLLTISDEPHMARLSCMPRAYVNGNRSQVGNARAHIAPGTPSRIQQPAGVVCICICMHMAQHAHCKPCIYKQLLHAHQRESVSDVGHEVRSADARRPDRGRDAAAEAVCEAADAARSLGHATLHSMRRRLSTFICMSTSKCHSSMRWRR